MSSWDGEPTTPAQSGDQIMVEAVDREAAAAYYYSAGGNQVIAKLIREGHRDNWFRVRDFAAHRIAALTACRAQVEGEIVAWLRTTEPSFKHGPALTHDAYRRDIADAITRHEHRSV